MNLQTIKELFCLLDDLRKKGILEWWYETDTTIGIMVGSRAYYLALIKGE